MEAGPWHKLGSTLNKSTSPPQTSTRTAPADGFPASTERGFWPPPCLVHTSANLYAQVNPEADNQSSSCLGRQRPHCPCFVSHSSQRTVPLLQVCVCGHPWALMLAKVGHRFLLLTTGLCPWTASSLHITEGKI